MVNCIPLSVVTLKKIFLSVTWSLSKLLTFFFLQIMKELYGWSFKLLAYKWAWGNKLRD